MHRLLPIALLYFIIAITGCTAEDKPSFSKLRVTVKQARNLFIDSVVFINVKTSDTVTARLEQDYFVSDPHYVHDSVPDGPVTINFVSRFNRTHTINLELKDDHTIELKPGELPGFEKNDSSVIRPADLPPGKEILIQTDFDSIVRKTKHEIRIKKEGAQYKLVFNSSSTTRQGTTKKPQVERVLDSSFVKTFFKFQEECNKLSGKPFRWCGYVVTFHIVYEDTLFTCHDPCTQWKGYDDFLKALDLSASNE